MEARDLRVSDAEREHVGALLQRAVGQGMLSLGEFTERMDTALAAKTRGELNAVLVDLPGMQIDPGYVAGGYPVPGQIPPAPPAPAPSPEVAPPPGIGGYPAAQPLCDPRSHVDRDPQGTLAGPARVGPRLADGQHDPRLHRGRHADPGGPPHRRR
ncbi:DUF1707 domain-containing protein, partial [Rhodococcus hoagii]|nr:DUF1707 domain-containing protein [Prescottella equi]